MKRRGRVFVLLLTLLMLGGCLLLLWRTGFFACIGSLKDMQDYISRFAPYSHLIFFLIQLSSTILAPIPSNITALAGGMLFGVWPAFFITAAAVFGGSLFVFCLARVLGQPFAGRLVSEKISDKYLDLIRRKRDIFLVLVFLFPFFPDDLICILAGLTDIGLLRFSVIVLLTRPWGLLVACALGGNALTIPLWGIALLCIAGAAVFFLCLRYGDQWEQAFLEKFKK